MNVLLFLSVVYTSALSSLLILSFKMSVFRTSPASSLSSFLFLCSFRGCKITYSFLYHQIFFNLFLKNISFSSSLFALSLLTQKTGGQKYTLFLHFPNGFCILFRFLFFCDAKRDYCGFMGFWNNCFQCERFITNNSLFIKILPIHVVTAFLSIFIPW